MKPRPPRSLLTQVALFSVAAMILAQIAGFWLFTAGRAAAIRADQKAVAAERAVRLAKQVDHAPTNLQAQFVDVASSRSLVFSVSAKPVVASATEFAVAWPGARSEEVAMTPHGRRPPPPGLQWLADLMLAQGLAPAELRLALPLADGRWLNANAWLAWPGAQLPPQALASTLLTLGLLLGALWLGLRRITRPLRALAAAADDFGLDSEPPPLPQGGPREARALAEALARMHARLARMIGERTRMLAALGHDLRSPITALRVQAAMVEDDETRERMTATLEEMQEMTEATLAFARGVSAEEPKEALDLTALLKELAADLSATGSPITVNPSEPAFASLRRVAIRRALRNLLENAQRYGDGATVGIARADDEIRVVIDDAGPGIPDADLARVFDPFERLEGSRSRQTGGTGLGLSIARSILRAHGGEVVLSNRPEGGLRATVRLPASADRE